MLAVQLGQQSEQLALHYLKKQGLRLIQRNYRCYHGEIDLIMQQQRTLVFVEVRLRTNKHYGSAIESITRHKIQRLIKTAQHYLICHRKNSMQSRFDVLGIDRNAKISWIRDAFTVEYQ